MSKEIGKTYILTVIREIRGSLGRFIALFGIVALGVGFLAGLLATTPDMMLSVDRYFDETSMMDVFVKGSMGLTQADERELAALDTVERVMGAYALDALIKTESDETLVARIYGLPLADISLNTPELIEGRMPQAPGECLAQQGGGRLIAPQIGTRVSISDETLKYNASFETLGDIFNTVDYTVTGIVKSPLFLATEREPATAGGGTLDVVMYVDKQRYNLAAYTDFFITLKDAAGLEAFSPAYQALVDAGVEQIEACGTKRALLRQQQIRVDAQEIAARKKNEALAEAEAEYEEGRRRAYEELAQGRRRLNSAASEIADGEEQLADAEARIADGKHQVAEGWARFAREKSDAEQELAAGSAKLKSGEAEIAQAKLTLAENKALLDRAREQVEKTRASWWRMMTKKAKDAVAQYDAGVAAYNAGVKTIAEQEAAIQQGWAELEAGRRKADVEFANAELELAAREAELAAGDAELASNRQKLLDARQELATGEARFARERENAESELRRGAEKLEEARAQSIKIDIPLPVWYVFDRNSNVGAAAYKANAEKINDVATVFPIFFLLIAALVSLTTMTRMVDEERTQIGTLKAMGYRKRAILVKYLVYCGLTGIAGSAAGMIIGFRVFPIAIYNAFGTLYHLPPLVTAFNWGFGLIACTLMLTCITTATIFACHHSLWEKPSTLMLPRAPKAGKRILLEYIGFIWKRMKFTHKVTARNLIRQKRHFFMTITGIAGCTALMVAGFGLRDSMVDIARTEFSDILLYDVCIELKPEIEEVEKIEKIDGLDDESRWIAVHSEAGFIRRGNERLGASLIIPQYADGFPDFINLRDRRTKKAIAFSDASVIVTEKAAERFNLNIGDTFTIENAEGKRGEFRLSGITENYVGVYCYIGNAAYRSAFHGEGGEYEEKIPFRTILAITGIHEEEAQNTLTANMLSTGTVMLVSFTSQTQSSYNNLLNSINVVVVILIVASGCLAMLVIYNLTNININERKREIATLRVLGFHQSEAAAYIFREITVLSITGAAVGLFLGIPLHRFIIGVAENADLMFGRRISTLGFALSGIITLLFSGGVDLLMLPKLRNIKMAESMKGAE
ncbi:MAG: ABC transporter permease [Treponema sp.]|jgi:putative ABC transport system permease protein|nr:ABC transporter permease [Treponema sp.]